MRRQLEQLRIPAFDVLMTPERYDITACSQPEDDRVVFLRLVAVLVHDDVARSYFPNRFRETPSGKPLMRLIVWR